MKLKRKQQGTTDKKQIWLIIYEMADTEVWNKKNQDHSGRNLRRC